MQRTRIRMVGSLITASALALASAGAASAHAVETVGTYTIEIGWQHEPTYVGEANGVQVIVTGPDDVPVTDLASGDLTVVVTTGSDQSSPLTFDPGFDPIEMNGPLGEYDAPIVPTAPGDYTFHLTGTIHGQTVDLTVTSGDETFDTVKDPSGLQFPATLPTTGEIVTRLDRIDARIGALGTSTGPSQASVDAAAAKAADAAASADRALLIGGGIGVVGVLVGLYGVMLAMRSRRRPDA